MTAEIAPAGLRIPPGARLIVVLVGAAWALVTEAIRLAAGWPITWVLGDLLPGLAFLLCGYIAWTRSPDNRIGPLMVAVGFAWYAGTAAATGDPLLDRTARAFQGYFDAFLAWLVLAYPTGYLRWRSSRVTVGALFALLIARSVFRLAVFPSTAGLDVGDPLAVDRYVAEVTLREAGETVFRVALAIVAIAVLALVIARLRAESRAGRAIAGPILLGGVGFAIGIVAEMLALAGANSFAARSVAWDVGQWGTVITASVIPGAFLVGLGQDRLARGRVADLVVGLGGSDPGPDDLQSALARAITDPSLTIAYPATDPDRFVDASGATVKLPPSGDPDRAATRIERSGRTIAVLVHDPALLERPDQLGSVAAAAGLALENQRLQAELRVQLAEVRASRARIVAAGDAERRRVERDLHDGAQQRLVTLALALQMARARAADGTELAGMLDRASGELERGLAELRDLARGIHPTVLTEDGLGPAIAALAERAPIAVGTEVADRRFEPAIEAAAYYVVAEALTNVAKYAIGAHATVRVQCEESALTIEVEDDGPGGAVATAGSGLQGLADRVAAVGGRLEVDSPPDRGTTVRAVLPCE
jgi:signal transduction histidine kinase